MSSSTGRRRATREALLESARSLVEERGPRPWTMEEVADRAGVTRMTAYRHFSSRSELLVATVHYVDEIQGTAEQWAPVARSRTGEEALDRWVEAWASYVPRIGGLAHALMAARPSDAAADAAWADRMAALHESCRRVVTWLDADGALEQDLDVEAGTDLMWALASVDLWTALTQERGWSPEQYRRALGSLLRAALLANTCHGRA